MDNVRTVTFMASQRGVCEDLYRCEETGKVYIRQTCDEDYVRWLTSSKWTGGYEADCPMREGLMIHIVDKAGNLLFQEHISKVDGYSWTVAEKVGPFSWEAISSISDGIAKKYRLRSYEEWEAWLIANKKNDGFIGERDTWLYANVEYGKTKKIAQFNVLGKTVYATVESAVHGICGKRWTQYELRSKDMLDTLDLCGFQFEDN